MSIKMYHTQYGTHIIVTPSGKVWLYDCGLADFVGEDDEGNYVLKKPHQKEGIVETYIERGYPASYGIADFMLKHYLGIDYIEGIFISHFHDDHIGGIPYIIEAFDGNIGGIYSPGVYSDDRYRDIILQDKVNEYCNEYDVPHKYINDSWSFNDPDCDIECVNPVEGDYDQDGTETTESPGTSEGVYIHFKYGDFSILFTGDTGYSLVRSHFQENVTAIQVPHHGDNIYITPENDHHYEAYDEWNVEFAFLDQGYWGGENPMDYLVNFDNDNIDWWIRNKGIPDYRRLAVAGGRLELIGYEDGSWETQKSVITRPRIGMEMI